jgi:heme-degrading monooxygenase HmoA
MIVVVNSFQLKTRPEEFEQVFVETSEFLRARPGFVSYRLVRSAKDPAHYLNIALWDSEAELRAATGLPEFQDHARRLRELAATDPQLFLPVADRQAAS